MNAKKKKGGSAKRRHMTVGRIAAGLLLCLLALHPRGNTSAAEPMLAPVRMLARIEAVGEKIEVSVIEGEYGANGTYLVITGEETRYIDEKGRAVNRDALKVGMTVTVTYSGQVMMSIPPQIVAKIIKGVSH